MGLIFIEGIPGAGKTELIRLMGKRGYNVVHELGNVIPSEEFPGNGNTLDESLEIDDWFIQKEAERLQQRSGIYDRSYLTHITYSFAYSNLTGIPALEHTIQKYALAIKEGKLLIPDSIVFIQLSVNESISRQIQRVRIGEHTNLPKFWADPIFLEDLRSAYEVLLSVVTGIKVVRIDGKFTSEEKLAGIEPVINYERTEKNIDLNAYVDGLKCLD